MNNITTTNKPSSQPLERKKIFGSVLDNPEYIEKKDRAGFPEDDESDKKGFDANNGGQLIFNLTKTGVPQIFQEAFQSEDISKLNPDAAAPSEIFQSGVYTALESTQNVIKKGVDTIGNLLEDSGGAFWDLAKTVAGKDNTEIPQAFRDAFKDEDSSKLDPNIQPKNKSEDLKNYSIIKHAQEVLEKAQNDYRGEEMLDAALNPKREEVVELANLQGNYRDVLDEKGEIRTDLQRIVEQVRAERAKQALTAADNSITNPSKHGAKGPALSNEDRKSGETHQTAQTATG